MDTDSRDLVRTGVELFICKVAGLWESFLTVRGVECIRVDEIKPPELFLRDSHGQIERVRVLRKLSNLGKTSCDHGP